MTHTFAKSLKKGLTLVALAVMLGAPVAHAAPFDRGPGGPDDGGPDGGGRAARIPMQGHAGGHFHGFTDHAWHAGGWRHATHNGRPGWWWVAGGRWFYYDQPVYPYPANPYAMQEVEAPVAVAPPPPEPSPGISLILPIHIR